MELEEMKNMWQKMDATLQQNRILNEQLVVRMLQDKSKTALQKIAASEYLSAATCALLLMVFGLQWWNLGNDGGLIACYVISMIVIVAALAASVYKIQYLSTIQPGIDTVTSLLQKTDRLRLFLAREKAVFMPVIPVMMFTIYAVVTYWVRGTNIMERMDKEWPRIIVAIVACFIGTLLVYRKVYFQTIRDIKSNLQEIQAFKNA